MVGFPLFDRRAVPEGKIQIYTRVRRGEGKLSLVGTTANEGIVVCANTFKTRMTTTTYKKYKKNTKFQTTN
jgi:hypothetical protein